MEFNKQTQGIVGSFQWLAQLCYYCRRAAERILLALRQQRRGWLTERLFPSLIVLLVVAITVGIFLYSDRIAEFSSYGYLGAFLANLVSNATVFLPIPGGLIILALGALLPPVLVGLAAGTGAAIGELVSYTLGYSGRGIIGSGKAYARSVEWLKKWGIMTIFVFTVTPLPLDLAGIAAGVLRFPVWKFFLACWFGKSLLSIATAMAGAWGWKLLLPYLN